jgi:hypothetical protein
MKDADQLVGLGFENALSRKPASPGFALLSAALLVASLVSKRRTTAGTSVNEPVNAAGRSAAVCACAELTTGIVCELIVGRTAQIVPTSTVAKSITRTRRDICSVSLPLATG